MASDARTAVRAVPDTDLLAGAGWECVSTAPGERPGPGDLGGDLGWLPAPVPGTVAGALRAAGLPEPPVEELDGRDWWYRCRFEVPAEADTAEGGAGGWVLELEGLATLADVWLDGRHLLRSESMFDPHRVELASPGGADGPVHELCVRFAALDPVLAQRRPRPRWKVRGVTSQNLRWLRTTLLGRQTGWAVVPAPVGPWRPVRLRRHASVEVVHATVRASCPPGEGPTSGTVTVVLDVRGPELPDGGDGPGADLRVAGRTAPLAVAAHHGGWRLTGSVVVDGVDRWWPHTHGDQVRYPVSAAVGGVPLALGEVGFRSVTVDRSDGGFRLEVNGAPVFCRGACWYPIDPVGLWTDDDGVEAAVDLARTSGANLLRIPGGTVYEDERFFEACDRAGVLVWQDAMLGPVDPPDDPAFLAVVDAEVSRVLGAASHPCLAVLCGGQELEERPAMFGLPRTRWSSSVIDTVLPAVVAREAPGLAYVPSSPTGGDLPFQVDAGLSHYFGVGMYLFGLDDLRRSAPRFVSEGLAFAVPPERSSVARHFGVERAARQEAAWKRAVHRDAGSWFDLEDVRDHYVRLLLGADAAALRRTEPERALDLGRAAVVEVVTAAAAEWRRPGSRCDGMVMIGWRDLRMGPGWGVVDADGLAKAPLFALARAWAPVAVLVTDEGANGLDVHVVNDTADDVDGTLVVGLHTAAHQVESASCPVTVPARGGVTVRADALFDGFRDLSYAYCFGARPYELVTVEVRSPSGDVVAASAHLPGGAVRDMEPDVGLQTRVERSDEGVCNLLVTTARFAQYVQVDVPGFAASDSWFHLAPGATRALVLRPLPGVSGDPSGRVRALNAGTVAVVGP